MDIYWYGQACFKLKGKNATILIDPYFPEFTGLKLPKDLIADAVLKTHDHEDHSNWEAAGESAVKISGPGEYEVKGVAITAVSVFHDSNAGADRGKNTVYNIEIDGLKVVHLGDLGHQLSEKQIEEIGETDILLIPTGGTYTIDSKEATKVVASLEPRIIIPMHYETPGLKFPLEPVSNFLKEMGAENIEALPKLSITKDKLPDEPETVLLAKQ